MQELSVQSLDRELSTTCLTAKKPKHKTETICNKFNEDFKNDSDQKKFFKK